MRLESEISPTFISTKWEWVSTWLKHYGDQIDYYFLVGEKNGNYCGITLLTKKSRWLPIPVNAYHIGTSGEAYKDQIKILPNSILVKKRI